MDRETLLKRTAIASARVQAAAIRLAEASPDVAQELLDRVRAPYGKREARVCNLMEAVAEVLDVVAPVAVETVAEVSEAREPVAVEPETETTQDAAAEADADTTPAVTPEAPTPRTGKGNRK